MEIQKICRTCLGLSGPLLSIYDGGGGGGAIGSLADMLGGFTKIRPKFGDKLPEKVCFTCVSEINRCYFFMLKCEHSNRTLRQMEPNALPEEIGEDFSKNKVAQLHKSVQTLDESIKLTKSVEVQTIKENEVPKIHQEMQTAVTLSDEEFIAFGSHAEATTTKSALHVSRKRKHSESIDSEEEQSGSEIVRNELSRLTAALAPSRSSTTLTDSNYVEFEIKNEVDLENEFQDECIQLSSDHTHSDEYDRILSFANNTIVARPMRSSVGAPMTFQPVLLKGPEEFGNLETKEDMERFLECKDQIIVESFKIKKKLSNVDRVKICKTIVKHLLRDHERRLLTSDMETISSAICQVFPGELPTTFFHRFGKGRKANGKLYDQYNNYRSALAAAGLIKRRGRVVCKAQAEDPLRPEDVSNDEDAVKPELEFLKSNTCLESCLEAWDKTHNYRQIELRMEHISICNYIRKYPILEQQNGYQLFFIDVKLKLKHEITLSIPNDLPANLLAKTKSSRSENIQKICELIENESRETNKSILTLMLLPFFFPTTLQRGSTRFLKPTKSECADTFICHFWNSASATAEMERIVKNSPDKYNSLKPRIFFIGSEVECAWVFVGHVKYSFQDLGEALKCAIAAYLALNIDYPSYSEKSWYVLQKYIFKISTPNDQMLDGRVRTLANDLNLIN